MTKKIIKFQIQIKLLTLPFASGSIMVWHGTSVLKYLTFCSSWMLKSRQYCKKLLNSHTHSHTWYVCTQTQTHTHLLSTFTHISPKKLRIDLTSRNGAVNPTEAYFDLSVPQLPLTSSESFLLLAHMRSTLLQETQRLSKIRGFAPGLVRVSNWAFMP